MRIIRKPTIGNDNPDQGRENTKKSMDASGKMGMSMLKKSEMSIVFLGAGLVTLIVFFIFFRPSGTQLSEPSGNSGAMALLEKRIEAIETHIKERAGLEKQQDANKQTPTLATYQARVERVEAALSVKFDAVTKRLGIIETKLVRLADEMETTKESITVKDQNKTVVTPEKKERLVEPPKETQLLKPPPPIEEKAVESKKLVLHRVEKGDTLYSISKKYNTTVDALRKLNKLSTKAEIYIGDNLIVR